MYGVIAFAHEISLMFIGSSTAGGCRDSMRRRYGPRHHHLYEPPCLGIEADAYAAFNSHPGRV
jgi:hypothetical protein